MEVQLKATSWIHAAALLQSMRAFYFCGNRGFSDPLYLGTLCQASSVIGEEQVFIAGEFRKILEWLWSIEVLDGKKRCISEAVPLNLEYSSEFNSIIQKKLSSLRSGKS